MRKNMLKNFFRKAFSLFLCILIFGLSIGVTSGKAYAASTSLISDETIDKFVELFYDAGSETAKRVHDILSGEEEGTLAEFRNIYENIAVFYGIVDKSDLFVETAARETLLCISTAYNFIEGTVEVYSNASTLFSDSANAIMKTVDGLQVLEGALKLLGLGSYFPSGLSLVLNVSDVAIDIAGYLEMRYFKEYVVFYEAEILFAYYSGKALPLPEAPKVTGYKMTQDEADSIYAQLYWKYYVMQMMDRVGKSISTNSGNTGDTGNTGNSITGGIAFEKSIYSIPMNETWQFTSKYYSPTEQTDITITYKSSNKSVFTATSGGLVTPVKEGTAQLIATASNGATASCRITVYPYDVTKNSTGYTISNYVGSGGNIVIPYEINGISVTEIGTQTFYDQSDITSVVIPDSIKTIGEKAFMYCDGLSSVTFSENLTNIGVDAFKYCTSLTSVTIPEGVTYISERAFMCCENLVSITIPKSVKSIGGYAFESCAGLTSVYITDIEAWCNIDFGSRSANPFYGAENLYVNGELVSDIVIPNTVTKLKDYVFCACDSLTSVIIPDSVTSIGKEAFAFCNFNSVVIGNSVTTIDRGAFMYCYSITSVTIPDSVTNLGDSAFGWCSNLTSVDMGDNVANIGDSAFSCCDSLTSITIPNNVKNIGESAFSDCYNLMSITLGNSVTSIGDCAFLNCTNLVSITIPDSVTNLGIMIFEGCMNLTSVIIGDGVTEIGAATFSNCVSLSSVTIGDSVTSIGYGAFNNCTNLTSIIIPDSVIIIDDIAFEYCTGLKSVTIGNSVETIGEGVFRECTNLTESEIPNNVTSIGKYAFSGCTNLTSVKISNSLANIGDEAFDGCTKLASVYITDVGAWCEIDFEDYTSNPMYYANNLYLNGELVTDIVIPSGVKTIPSYAFSGSKTLTSVTIPDSITSIGVGAFKGCTNLKSVYITDIDAWCDIVFDDYTSNPLYYANNFYLNSELVIDVLIPEGTKEIPSYAFYSCDNLMSITIPSSITTIGKHAFSGCNGLKYVYYLGSESDWANISIGTGNTPITKLNVHFNDIDHTFEYKIDIEVTCIKDGLKHQECIVCGYSLESEVVSATGHIYSDEWTIDKFATCTEDGSKSHHCIFCGDKKDITVVAATGHNYEITDTLFVHPHTITHTCSYCEDKKINNSIISDCIQCIYGTETPIKETENTKIDFNNFMIFTGVDSCSDITEILGVSESATVVSTASCVSSGLELYGTGTIVTVFDGDKFIGEFTLIIEGDTNGDSVCNVLDVFDAERASNGNLELSGAYAIAADTNSDDAIDISDYQSIVNKAIAS